MEAPEAQEHIAQVLGFIGQTGVFPAQKAQQTFL